MLISACGTLLSSELVATAPVAPEGTPLAALAVTMKGMARAYADDGSMFLSSGDRVNALAAYYYGFAWLHFGRVYGLLSSTGNAHACPFTGQQETLPPVHAAHLNEKTRRYARLLETACASVVPAPEPETAGGVFARRVILVSTCYARGGGYSLVSGAEEAALALFSYGHGWLDAGVRAGLLEITGNREIFTI
jgi:hypothetical protein